MGAALDADSMNGGVNKAVRRAALEKCMEKRGWSQRDPAEAEEKAVRKASRKAPTALDAWIKANEPAVVQVAAPAPATPPVAAPAPVMAQAAPAAESPAPAAPPAAAAVSAPVAVDQGATPPKP
jgi:hypothetical protein